MTSNQLNSLLQSRMHGAINIRGVRFQLLFGLWQAMHLYDTAWSFEAVGLERFEDVDLYPKPLQLVGGEHNHYYQAKTSEGPWYPSQLVKPLRSFLEILRTDPDGHFSLVFNFSPTGEVSEMVEFARQKAAKQRAIRKKFRNLCQQAGRASQTGKIPALHTTEAEADSLWERLHFITHTENELVQQIQTMMAVRFDVAGGRIEEYLAVFFHRFALWSQERRRVVRADLDGVRDQIGANLAFEREFAARGTLLKPIDWADDAQPDDFREGKRTRAGHIAAALDATRPRWHQAIKTAFESKRIVVVRASSGQGKSTLALRFVHDEWPQAHTLTLLSARTEDEAELVCEALRHRAQTLQLPTFLLIDNASRRTAYWPRVAQECAHLGISALVTLRQEDWVRFAQESLFSSAPVEPSLQWSEAREIFQSLRAVGRVHQAVPSPEWAWEKIGEPRLLMEFIYLLTHGKMLEERLREQLEEIRQHESPLKLEILRRVAMADALGAPLNEVQLFDDLRREWGPAEVAAGAGALLKPMDGEYLQRFDSRVFGLHWVRSDHLVRLLHDGSPLPAQTALAVLNALSPENFSDAVANALLRSDIEREAFINGLVERARSVPLSEMLSTLQGIFESGEAVFFETNRSLFDEGFAFGGQSGPSLLLYDWVPAEGKRFLQHAAEITAEKSDSNVQKLALISRRFRRVARGQEECRRFLQRVASTMETPRLLADIGTTGDLLSWLGWCEVPFSQWPEVQAPLFEHALAWDFPIESLCSWHEGLWLFDRAAYVSWITRAPEELRDYVQWQLGCLQLHWDAPPPQPQDGGGTQGTVALEYLGQDFKNANVDSVGRIQKLYSLFPFYAHYNAHAFWPLEWPMAYDPSLKEMTQKYQFLRFFVARNSTWARLVETRYEINTFYDFQKGWHEARQRAVIVLKALAERLEMLLAGTSNDLFATFGGQSDVVAFQNVLIQTPKPPEKTPEELKEKLKAATEWNSHMTAWLGAFVTTAVFFQQNRRLPLPIQDDDSPEENGARAAHLTLYNFRDAAKDLRAMQEAMCALFEVAGDVCDARSLEAKEDEVFERVLNALEVWLEDRPSERGHDLNNFLVQKREQQQREITGRVRAALAPLEAQSMAFLYPTGLYQTFPLSYLPVMFEVSDPCDFLAERNAVLAALEPLHDVANFGCLIPIFKGERFLPGGFLVALRPPSPDDEDGRRTREAVLLDVAELPDGVWPRLPARPLREHPRLVVKTTLHALLLGWQAFARQHNRLKPLAAMPGRFTRQLFEQYRNRLLSQPLGGEVPFERIETLLTEEFPNQAETAAYGIATSLIEVLRSWNQAQKKLQHAESESSPSDDLIAELNAAREMLWQSAQELVAFDFDVAHIAIMQLTTGSQTQDTP
jgi:hypothetical protein